MRDFLWLQLRNSRTLRRIHRFPFAGRWLDFISCRLMPSSRKRVLRVRWGPAAGLKFQLNPRWEVLLWQGKHEVATQEFIASRIARGSVMYDVGAGFGYCSCLAARLGASVFAFEPDAHNADALAFHSQINGLCASISLHRLAVLDYSGSAEFTLAPQGQGHGNGTVAEDGTLVPTVCVRCITLDEFALDRPGPALIKIDVEGTESHVLRGASNVFERYRPALICEVHDEENESFVSEWLRQRGYDARYPESSGVYPKHIFAEHCDVISAHAVQS
jgi:FkbM family methyltransferase